MVKTDKKPARSFRAPRGLFAFLGYLAGVLLHADPEPDADRIIRADVNPLHQPRDDHLPGFRIRFIEGVCPRNQVSDLTLRFCAAS